MVGGRGRVRTGDPLLAKQALRTRPPAYLNGYLVTLSYVSVYLTRPVSVENGRKVTGMYPYHDPDMTLGRNPA